MDILENCLIQVIKALGDYLFLLIIMLMESHIILTKDFSSRIEIENYNIEVDGRNFYDQPISELTKQQDKVRKKSTGQGDDYTAGCLLDFVYFEKSYRLIAVDLSKQKALDAESIAIQQIIFTGTASAAVIIYYILEQSKETILEFSKGTTKVF